MPWLRPSTTRRILLFVRPAWWLGDTGDVVGGARTSSSLNAPLGARRRVGRALLSVKVGGVIVRSTEYLC